MKTRLRVAGIWIERGAVLLESLVDRDVWGVPGGKLEDGETLADGLRREFQEELGMKIQVGRLAVVHEHFWEEGDEAIREYGFYFSVEPLETSDVVVRSREPYLKFAWFDLAGLADVMLIPDVLKTILPELPEVTLYIDGDWTFDVRPREL